MPRQECVGLALAVLLKHKVNEVEFGRTIVKTRWQYPLSRAYAHPMASNPTPAFLAE